MFFLELLYLTKQTISTQTRKLAIAANYVSLIANNAMMARRHGTFTVRVCTAVTENICQSTD